MPDGRCPSCGASVRAGADWCTLCYADLRPAPPPPPPPPPAPEPVAVAAPVPVAVSVAAGPDPLSASYDEVLGAALAGTPLAGPPEPTWPCFDCGGANSYDETACTTCGAVFGARLADKRVEVPRRKRIVRVLVGLGAFLALVAIVSYVLTPVPEDLPASGGDEVVQIDSAG